MRERSEGHGGAVVELDVVVYLPVTVRVEAMWSQAQEVAEVHEATPLSVPAITPEGLTEAMGEEGQADLDGRVLAALWRRPAPPWPCGRCGELTSRIGSEGSPECPGCDGQEVGL